MPQSGYKRFGRFEIEEKVVDVPGAALEKTFVPEFMPLGGKLRASLFSLSSGQNVKSIEVFEVDPESGFPRRRSHPGDLRWNVREKRKRFTRGKGGRRNAAGVLRAETGLRIDGHAGKGLLERFIVVASRLTFSIT